MTQVLSIDNLRKNFGSKQVLKGVSFRVNQGEIFGFLGPNGAGKTTTIRCMMDFIRPNGGSIQILGSSDHPANLNQEIGYLAAEDQLIAKWNAKEHISFYCSIKKAAKRESDRLLKDLDLDPTTMARHLSSGNRQKLGLILALIGQPKLLILDEPTRGLDPLLQNEIYRILKDFAGQGGTVFLSSHNLPEVEHLCTNVGIIRSGEMATTQSLDDLRVLKTHIVNATFPEKDVPKLSGLKGLDIIDQSSNKLTIKLHGDINPLIAELSKHHLNELEITHASLEEIFIEYYEGDKHV